MFLNINILFFMTIIDLYNNATFTPLCVSAPKPKRARQEVPVSGDPGEEDCTFPPSQFDTLLQQNIDSGVTDTAIVGR